MSKRYYLDKLTQDDRGRWVPAIKLSAAWATEMANNPAAAYSVVTSDIDPNTGQPTDLDCFVVVNALNHAALGQVAALLPDFPLDSKVGSMHQATKVAMRDMLVARGIPATVTDNADGFRDIVSYIGKTKLNNAGFNPDNFDA